MKCRNEIKSICAKQGITLTKLANKLGEKMNKKYTLGNLSKKLNSGKIPFCEMELIVEILGYSLKFVEHKK